MFLLAAKKPSRPAEATLCRREALVTCVVYADGIVVAGECGAAARRAGGAERGRGGGRRGGRRGRRRGGLPPQRGRGARGRPALRTLRHLPTRERIRIQEVPQQSLLIDDFTLT